MREVRSRVRNPFLGESSGWVRSGATTTESWGRLLRGRLSGSTVLGGLEKDEAQSRRLVNIFAKT